jgi:hypothetical protein
MLALALGLALAACGDRPSAPAPAQKPAQGAAKSEPKTVMRARTNLYLYDNARATGGAADSPRFEVRDVDVVMDETGAYSFENPHAIIYGRDGTQTTLTAGRGKLDEKQGRAMLTGGVTMQMGARTVQLQDIEWQKDTGVAKSDNPVTLRDGNTEIQAKRMHYDPDTKLLVMEDFTAKMAYQRSEGQ